MQDWILCTLNEMMKDNMVHFLADYSLLPWQSCRCRGGWWKGRGPRRRPSWSSRGGRWPPFRIPGQEHRSGVTCLHVCVHLNSPELTWTCCRIKIREKGSVTQQRKTDRVQRSASMTQPAPPLPASSSLSLTSSGTLTSISVVDGTSWNDGWNSMLDIF